MDSLALHIVFWLAALALALVCLGRAWIHGRAGLDEYSGVARDMFEHQKVQLWGIAGIALLAFALLDVFLFFNPEPASR